MKLGTKSIKFLILNRKANYIIFDILGWIGMILILLAYALLPTNKIENRKLYQGLNLVADILIVIGLFPTKA